MRNLLENARRYGGDGPVEVSVQPSGGRGILEVRGHGPGQEVLQAGKRAVEIRALEPVGSYAVQPQFSDGHGTGIYSWEYLYELGENQDELWKEYLEKLAAAGASRDG